MIRPFSLAQAIQSLGVAQIFLTDDYTAEVEVDTAGATKGATSIPVKALPVALPDGFVLEFDDSAHTLAVLTAAAAKAATSLTVEALAASLAAGDLAYPWENIGALEGDASETLAWTLNELTAPQQTGDTPHQSTVVPGKQSVTIPVIGGTPRLLTLLSPTGDEDGAADSPTPVKEKAMFLVPRAELGTGISYGGTTWDPAAPVNSLFFPRCYLSHGAIPRPYANGGKAIIQATVTAMYANTGPANKRIWVRGDPVAKGYTLFRI